MKENIGFTALIILTLYVIVVVCTAVTNVSTRADVCARSGRAFINNPLMLGLTGDCVEKAEVVR